MFTEPLSIVRRTCIKEHESERNVTSLSVHLRTDTYGVGQSQLGICK